MTASSSPCLVLVSLPDEDTARSMARLVVEKQLAACATWHKGWTSVYRWEGKIETAEEVLWLAKTTRARWEEVRQTIRREHPYECPEILCFDVADGHPPYLAWLAEQTSGPAIP